jgi:serine/threonine protein kinase
MEINSMKDEYAKLFRVDHINIIKVYGQGKSHITKINCKQKQNIFYLKMQFVSGGNLEDFVDLFDGTLNEDKARYFFV